VPNTDDMGNCLQQPGQLSNQPQKSTRANSFQLIKSCCSLTDPATETTSQAYKLTPGLSRPPDPTTSLSNKSSTRRSDGVFANPSRQLHRDHQVLHLITRSFDQIKRHLDTFEL
jgi:hypothetical protein